MTAREEIISELSTRLLSIPYIKNLFVDPRQPPGPDEFPCIVLLSREDTVLRSVLDAQKKGFSRQWNLHVIPFLVGSDGFDETAARDIELVKEDIRMVLYRSEPSSTASCFTLSGKVAAIYETGLSELVKPHAGQPGVGLVIPIVVCYSEELNSVLEASTWHYSP